jgi:hypothetical protein
MPCVREPDYTVHSAAVLIRGSDLPLSSAVKGQQQKSHTANKVSVQDSAILQGIFIILQAEHGKVFGSGAMLQAGRSCV